MTMTNNAAAVPDAAPSSSEVEVLSVGDIIAIAFECGYVQYRPMVSATLYFEQRDPPFVENDDGTTTAATPIKINVYYTTRSLMTHLPHPTRGTNQMWRSGAYQTAAELRNLFRNPRQHTPIGYRDASKAKRGCAGCGELKSKKEYSQNQWRLGPDKNRCKDCVRTGKGRDGAPSAPAGATDGDVSDLTDRVGSMRLTADALEEHVAKIKKEEQGQSKKGGKKNAKAIRDGLERRQFNCPRCPKEGRVAHVFFKKVPKYKPMVKCPKCKRATRGKCRRILAVPRDAERGYGLYRCMKCKDGWGSSRAVGGIGQECYSCREKGDGGVMVIPFRIEVPRPKKKRVGGYASELRSGGMRRVPHNPIGEDAPAEHGYGEADQQRNERRGDQALFPDSAHSRSYDYEPRQTSADGVGSEAGASTPISTKPSGYRHHCTGCTSGICRNRRVPKSQVHDVSDGDTVSTRSSVVTNSSVDKSDFLDRDDDFRAFEVDDIDNGDSSWVNV